MDRKIKNINYSVSIVPLEDGGYMANVLELKGCYTVGKTLAEIEKNLPEAIDSYIGALKKLNKPIPKPIEKRNFSGELRLRIPKELHKQLTLIAKMNNVSLNTFIISLLSQKTA